MKKIISVLMIALIAIVLIGCSSAEAPTGFAPNQVVEAYAYTHGGYVGQAVVTTDADGRLDVTLDEAFLPHSLAVVTVGEDGWTEDNTVFYIQRGSEVRVAKWVEYDGTVYTGSTVGTALVYVAADENGEAAGNTVLEKAILRNHSTMEAYYDIIAAGGFKIFKEFGGQAEAVETTNYGGLFKRGSEYWNFGLGWMGNIEAIEEFAETTGVGFSPAEIVRASEEDSDGMRKWSVADAVTGATASDFYDYFGLIQKAVGQLKMQ